MKVKVYNLEGKAVKDLELSDAVFGVAVKPTVVHQVFTQQAANQRESWAATKTRGDVRGGGKKPWPQKGTGRARHGSSRSPIWKGGGVTMGPKADRNYKTKINKETRRLAIRMCLSDKATDGAIYVIENFAFSEPKTKLFATLLKSLKTKQHSYAVLTAGKDASVMKMTQNIPNLATIRAEDASVLDLVNKQAIVTTVDGIKTLEKTFGKK